MKPFALALAALVATTAMAGPATADDQPIDPARRLMVVGDSISALSRYGEVDTLHRIRAWWSYVRASLGPEWTVKVSAEPGSGMLNRGVHGDPDLGQIDDPRSSCNGSTFGGRIDRVRETRPSVLIIEGGRNDFKKCVHGKVRGASVTETRRAVKDYLAQLAAVTDEIGLARERVYVTTPWGTSFAAHRDVVLTAVERYATSQGFRFVPLPVLEDRYTKDRTHPTTKGSKRLAQLFLAASDIQTHGDLTPEPGTAPVRPSCTGYHACRERYGRIGYQSVRTSRFWSQSPSAQKTNYIAYRLTHDGLRTARIPGATPDEWHDSARREGVAVDGLAKVGSVAWWPVDPVDGSPDGLVAYVTKVADGVVTVIEARPGDGYNVVRYSGAAYPREFLHFPRSDGSPTGRVSVASVPHGRKLKLSGHVTDPDAYGRGVPIRVTVTKGSWSRSYTPRTRPRYDVALTVAPSWLPTGRVTVKVYAGNVAGGGKDRVRVGEKSVTIS